MTSPPPRKPRADARRSRAAILEAAPRVLDADPDAGLEAVAVAAGVTRQTVYAHFPSREQLLLAVVDRITEEAVAAMDAVDLDTGPAADVLMRLLDAGMRAARRYPVLLQKISALPVSPQTERDQHRSVADRVEQVILRGRDTGEFDDRLPVDWLVAATIRLGHLASEEQDEGRMSETAAQDALRKSLFRLLDAIGEGGTSRTRG
ncbi:TetR/AcrR family transcriptional regulator [Streptomyces sp. NPDC004232]|uniref:TetR/AcrR family transcriptional regulator n=1 Tax=Streptomyces sp. NPDC004232 TaxID=3154454 RepID=UPI001E07F1F9|nr:TetR/AcrR family transcriptional regulator [Streptomyces sp. tea 10]